MIFVCVLYFQSMQGMTVRIEMIKQLLFNFESHFFRGLSKFRLYRIACKVNVYFVDDPIKFTIRLTSGPGCSKLTTSLVDVSLKFQTLISEICQYFC